jgi:hypothetical protein
MTITKNIKLTSHILLLTASVFFLIISYVQANTSNVITQKEVSEAFKVLRNIAEGANHEGSIGGTTINESCRVVSSLGQEKINQWIEVNNEYALVGRLNLRRICNSFTEASEMAKEDVALHLKETTAQALTERIVLSANQSNLPYLNRLEFEGHLLGDDATYSVTSLQPLWNSENRTETIFNQISWYHEGTDTDDGDADDTVNFGLAYRKLAMGDTLLFGTNAFFDHQLDQNHNRLSIGADAQTSLYGIAGNYYIPLTGWKQINSLNEAKALSGWDIELSGNVPNLPSWTLYTKGFTWHSEDDVSDIYGYETNLEWSPVQALTAVVGVRDENKIDPEINAALRFNINFNEPIKDQFDRRTGLDSVADRMWEKVRRENTIRTQVRKRDITKLTVIETTGTNRAVTEEGTFALSVGIGFNMPADVYIENAIGAIARLQTIDGGILTLSQDTHVLIEPGLLTLINGAMQYVSGTTDITVVVPGGTITLLGTDIDVVSDGTNSSVRVRDGAVRFVGTVSGASVISGTMANVTNGTVTPTVVGSPTHNAHVSRIIQTIDWVASPQDGGKVAPYMVTAPYLAQENLTPGDTLEIGLSFNEVLTVSGGTPDLNFEIGGNQRTAPLISGNGTTDLIFGYVVQVGDAGATNITVTGLTENGSIIMGGDKLLLTSIPDTIVNFTGTVTDVTAPSGYAVSFTTDPIDGANENAAAFQITGAEIGTTYNYTITSSGGGGNVTASGTIATATQNITGIDVSGLPDGTLTLSLTLTDGSANTGTAATDTVVKNLAPVLNLVAHETDSTDTTNYTFAGTSIGAAAADRLVIVMALTSNSGSHIDSITLDGNPMTIHAQGNASGNWQNAAIASLPVPAGTTADIVMTTSATATVGHIFVYAVTGLDSMFPTGSASGGHETQINLSVPVAENGFIIGGAHVEVAAGSPAIWTTADALAVTDGEGPDDFYHYYAGHSEGLSANANYPVGFRNGSDRIWFGAAMASWR